MSSSRAASPCSKASSPSDSDSDCTAYSFDEPCTVAQADAMERRFLEELRAAALQSTHRNKRYEVRLQQCPCCGEIRGKAVLRPCQRK